ncbi:MAG: TlpA disulfide reductase family protein, partial [Candidatus Poribacteria bacterium]
MKIIKYVVILLIPIILSISFVVSCQKKIEQTDVKTNVAGKSDEPKTQSQVAESSLSKAPMFDGVNLVDGSQFSLANLKDYVLIIDFWAPWCPPCKAEIPGFIELHNKYQDKKFAIVGIVVSAKESDTKKYIADQKVNYPIIMGTEKIV